MGHETFPNPDITERTEIGAIEVLKFEHPTRVERQPSELNSPTSLDSAVGGASECNISHILGASFS